MKQTEKYQLNLIEPSDSLLPTPINENTQTLETQLAAHCESTENPHGVTAAQAGAAAASHTHAAADLTSGVLPVTRGGTGHATIDSTPKVSSTKMVTSGGVYAALKDKFGSTNLPWVTGTYTGTGAVGESVTIAVGFKPSAVFVVSAAGAVTCFGMALRADTVAGSFSTVGTLSVAALSFSDELGFTYNGFTVTRSADTATRSLNEADVQYVYLALKA